MSVAICKHWHKIGRLVPRRLLHRIRNLFPVDYQVLERDEVDASIAVVSF